MCVRLFRCSASKIIQWLLITLECYPFRRSSIGTFIRSHPSSESSASSQSNKPKKEAPPKLDYRSMVSIDDMPALFVSFDSKLQVNFFTVHVRNPSMRAIEVTVEACMIAHEDATHRRGTNSLASSFSSFALFLFRWMRKVLHSRKFSGMFLNDFREWLSQVGFPHQAGSMLLFICFTCCGGKRQKKEKKCSQKFCSFF